MYVTRPALEQASAYEVGAYRARRYRPYPCRVDLGCSVGGDTLTLCEDPLAQGAQTLGIDRDPLRLAMARANLQALGLDGRASFLQADLEQPLPLRLSAEMALFFDPARRTGHRRAFSVRDYQPPLETLQTWLPACPALGVKVSPGVDLHELAGLEAEIEFISLRGELKEAALWFGPLLTARRRATLLPGPHTLVEPAGAASEHLPLSDPDAYLYEPDPAVLRAGLVADLGWQLSAAQLDPEIAYLTAENKTPTPFARVWAVEDWLPFGVKRLRAYLRQRGVGRVVVKKRGSPLQPEELAHALHLKGDQERVVFLTHLRGRPIVVICFA
jgi:hypothetical protein